MNFRPCLSCQIYCSFRVFFPVWTIVSSTFFNQYLTIAWNTKTLKMYVGSEFSTILIWKCLEAHSSHCYSSCRCYCCCCDYFWRQCVSLGFFRLFNFQMICVLKYSWYNKNSGSSRIIKLPYHHHGNLFSNTNGVRRKSWCNWRGSNSLAKI